MEYFCYWAKAEKHGSAFHLLPYHLLDVAAVGCMIMKRVPHLPHELHEIAGVDEDTARSFLCFLLSLHDFGKFSHTFQCLRKDIDETLCGRPRDRIYAYGTHHSVMGKLLWDDHLILQVKKIFDTHGESPTTLRVFRHTFEPWVHTVMGHHGTPVAASGGLLRDKFDARDKDAAETLCGELLRLYLPGRTALWEVISKLGVLEKGDVSRLSWLFAGFAVLCDWVGSNAALFPLRSEEMSLETYWRRHALPQAERALQTLMLLPSAVRDGMDFQTLFNITSPDPSAEITPTPLQRFALECEVPDGPNLYIMEDMTGSGKTEAALSLAYRMMKKGQADGWYFALPTQATSNGIFARTSSMYERCFDERAQPTIVLAHGGKEFHAPFQSILAATARASSDGSTMSDAKGEEFPGGASCSAWLAEDSRRAFLANVGVGTIDQALLSVLPVRYQSLRLFGLSRKVLIVDEVHAYDSYMRKLLAALLSFHSALGGSAILLSATLPTGMRRELIGAFLQPVGGSAPQDLHRDYPLATHVALEQTEAAETPISCRSGGEREVRFLFPDSDSAVFQRIEQAIAKRQCVCWIRNTVNDAIDAFRILAETYGTENIDLFHARFTQHDRSSIENRVMTMFGKESTPEQRAGRILVATQVVEQSLDLDFDVLISDLAPVDLLIQRAGRLHRHKRGDRGKPEMLVYGPAPVDDADDDWYSSMFPRAAWVYEDHGRLWLTARALRERDGVQCFPEHARTLVEAVYDAHSEESMPPGLRARHDKAEGKAKGQGAVATARVLDVMDGYTAQNIRWENDQLAATRLGADTVKVILLKRIGDAIEPWHGDFEGGFMKSGLNYSAFLFHTLPDGVNDSVVKEFLEKHRAVFKWARPLLLMEDHGVWYGRSRSKKEEDILWRYDIGFGLQKADPM